MIKGYMKKKYVFVCAIAFFGVTCQPARSSAVSSTQISQIIAAEQNVSAELNAFSSTLTTFSALKINNSPLREGYASALSHQAEGIVQGESNAENAYSGVFMTSNSEDLLDNKALANAEGTLVQQLIPLVNQSYSLEVSEKQYETNALTSLLAQEHLIASALLAKKVALPSSLPPGPVQQVIIQIDHMNKIINVTHAWLQAFEE